MTRETTSSTKLKPRLRLRVEEEIRALHFKAGFLRSGGEQATQHVRGPNPNSVQVQGRGRGRASTTKQSTSKKSPKIA